MEYWWWLRCSVEVILLEASLQNKNTYNFYLEREVPDHVYVFYAYRLYFAYKDIYMIRYFYHKIEIIRVLLMASISVWAILVARNIIMLYCINTCTLYHGLSTTDIHTETWSEHN